ncbi:MAG: hypothetical protein K1X51_12465 [Rhodospirillaceae bacterium]|nr:hypothetical protein [Rhodospirillaceae bacterium]
MPMNTRTALAAAFSLALVSAQAHAADAGQPLGIYDPEASCKSAVETPVCAYKTWFFCRIAGQRDMCRHVLGKEPAKDWEDKPWVLPLSVLMSGPLALNGFAFIGSLKVDRERLGDEAPDAVRKQLLGTVEVMDTYVDPQQPTVPYIGSEFYTETKPGEWKLVGWSIAGEGGKAPTECDAPAVKNDDICKLRVTGIKTWVQMLRSMKPKN